MPFFEKYFLKKYKGLFDKNLQEKKVTNKIEKTIFAVRILKLLQ